MRLRVLTALSSIVFAILAPSVLADTPSSELSSLFPERIGSFRRVGLPTVPDAAKSQDGIDIAEISSNPLRGVVEYSGRGNERLRVEVIRFRQDPEAYSMLTFARESVSDAKPEILVGGSHGTAGFGNENLKAFFKGLHFVRVTALNKSSENGLDDFTKAIAETFDKGENDIPALVKHLPNEAQSQRTARYLTRFKNLQTLLPNQPVLSAINSGGNGDAAVVDTGSGKVLVVEFNTPQLAKDNDDQVIAKIKELWQSGQPAPTAYRRVGNYSVFVFDAPSETVAKQLIDQVKYEQVVQWLGDNPHIYKEAERRYVETTLGVFIAVLKASGYAAVGCLALGGLLGTLLFVRRKAQKGMSESYSDAGGMLRLNIDELTPQTDPGRLLGPGR